MVKRAVTMAEAGESAAKIGRAVGKSRSAVCGRLFRMGIQLKGKSGGAAQARNVERRAKPKPSPRSVPRARQHVGAPRPEYEPMTVTDLPPIKRAGPLPINTAAAVLELEVGECKFPVGVPGIAGFHFCRSVVRGEGQPYCAAHHAVCNVPHIPKHRRRSGRRAYVNYGA